MKIKNQRKEVKKMEKWISVMALVVVLAFSGIASAFTCDMIVDDNITFRTESFLPNLLPSVMLPFSSVHIKCPGFVEIEKRINSTYNVRSDKNTETVQGKPSYYMPESNYICQGNIKGQPIRNFINTLSSIGSLLALNVNMDINCLSLYMADILKIKRWEIPLY
ncbi:MAG: hypothetical protein ABIN05_07910 [candidate division WOR-3 bacterium]